MNSLANLQHVNRLRRLFSQVAQRLTALPDVKVAGALAVNVRSIQNTVASFESAVGQAEAKFGCGISTVGSRRLGGSRWRCHAGGAAPA